MCTVVAPPVPGRGGLRAAGLVAGLITGLSAGLVGSPAALAAPRPKAPPPARPEQKTPEQKAAERHFQSGVALFQEAKYAEALAEFERAYEIAPQPLVLYNIAGCHRELSHYSEAVTFYRRFLADGKGKAKPARLAAAQAELDGILARIARVTVTVTPGVDGVTLILDGTPLDNPVMPLILPPGEHRLAARAAGRSEGERSVRLASGDEIAVELVLAERPTPVDPPPAIDRPAAVPGAPAARRRFPQACQIALPFAVAAGNTVDNLCGGDFTHQLYSAGDTPPPLAASLIPELGKAADITADAYFTGTGTLDKSHDVTVQFWVKLRGFVDVYNAWLFSDLDLDVGAAGGGGGLGIAIVNTTPPKLDVTTCTKATAPLMFEDAVTAYPADGSWQFVRVVHTNGNVYVCLNGVRKTSFAAPAGLLKSTFPPHLGRNVVWTPAGAFFDGELDDVRVLTGALPCD